MARPLLSPQPPQPRTLSAALLTALQRCMLRVGAQGSGAESPAPHFPVSHVRRPPVEQGRGPRWNSRTWLPPRVLAPSPCLRICQNKTKKPNFCSETGRCGLFLAHLMRSASISGRFGWSTALYTIRIRSRTDSVYGEKRRFRALSGTGIHQLHPKSNFSEGCVGNLERTGRRRRLRPPPRYRYPSPASSLPVGSKPLRRSTMRRPALGSRRRQPWPANLVQ